MQDLFSWAWGVHGVVLPLSLAGLYRYSDRSTLFSKTLGDTDQVLGRVRRQVATALEEELAPVFQRAEGIPRIVSPHAYAERPADPVRSDAFREAIQRFVHSQVNALAAYTRMYRARIRWARWARLLSWTVLALSLWEALCLALLAIRTVYDLQMPEALVEWSLAPTTILVLAFFGCHAGLFRQHDVIHEHRTQNPEF